MTKIKGSYSNIDELFDCLVEEEGARVNYEPREIVYREGKPDNKIYRVEAGGVSQSQRIKTGKLLTYHILLPGDIFSTYHLSSDAINQPCTAKALVETTLQEIIRGSFKHQLLNNPKLILDVADVVSNELQTRDRTLESHLALNAKEMVYFILQKLSPLGEKTDEGQTINFITRNELAEMAGMTEETVSRSLTQLEEEGKIKKNRGRVILL